MKQTVSEKSKGGFCQNGKIAVKLWKVIFQKSQKLLAENLHKRTAYSEQHSLVIHSISMTAYVTAPPAFVHGKLHALEESRLCNFFLMSSYNFTAFFSILTRANFCVFRCAWYWVLKLICVQYDFNAVDCSERRSEEVIHISFFWHSV